MTRNYEHGDRQTGTFSHQCVELECGDDDVRFAEAFVPHIRNGTVVRAPGKSPLVREEWTDGRPALVVDWRIITTTDDVIDEYIAHVKEKGAAISLMKALPAPCDTKATSKAKGQDHLVGDDGIATKTQRHCGLYCVYAAVRTSGRKVGFTELLKPQYLGSVKGSSVFELERAAKDQGLYAESMQKLTTADLKASPYCCILHVKPNFKSVTYSHYVLFLGMEDDKAVLYDAPDLHRVPLSDLAPLWGGNGLVLASQPIDVGRLVARGRARLIGWFLAALGMVALVHGAKRSSVASSWCLRRRRSCLVAVQAVALAVAALFGGLANHSMWDTGLLANRKGTTLLQQAHSGDFLPRIGLRRAQSLLAEGAVFVDARFRRNYEAGCVPGALSIPVDANESQYENMIVRIPQNAPVVVYCQSAKCPFAGEIAGRLARDNFQKVSIFAGGWYEWARSSERKAIKSHDAIPRATGAGWRQPSPGT